LGGKTETGKNVNESKNIQENFIRWPIAARLQKRTTATSDKSLVVKLRLAIRNKKRSFRKQMTKEWIFKTSEF